MLEKLYYGVSDNIQIYISLVLMNFWILDNSNN